ncbi:MAG: hypothetical protein ACOYN0_06540 [Phycisphaerales bacterium]
MKLTRILLNLLALFSAAPAARADTTIEIMLLYKVIRNPVDGSFPPGYSEAGLLAAVDRMNEILESVGSVYRFRGGFANPIGTVGGFDRPDPSAYYLNNLLADQSRLADFVSDANEVGWLYHHSQTSFNIYINQGSRTTTCISPSAPVLVMDGFTSASATIQLHQIGHLMGLCNTQGCSCVCCPSGSTGECATTPGSDGLSDTLPDLPCWDQNQISQHSFGSDYFQLNSLVRDAVDDVFFNVMALHSRSQCGQLAPISRMTEQQLERFADTASGLRVNWCDGMTFFVDDNAPFFQNGRSVNPFARVAQGIAAADGGGDIIMIRAGNYPERLIIRNPVTLRAPRGQTARIGQ